MFRQFFSDKQNENWGGSNFPVSLGLAVKGITKIESKFLIIFGLFRTRIKREIF